jgi:hypothetical protein
MPGFFEIAAVPAEIAVVLYEAGEIDYFAKHINSFLLIFLKLLSTSGSEPVNYLILNSRMAVKSRHA